MPLIKKKHIRLGQAGIVDNSVDLSMPDLRKKKKKRSKKKWTEAIKNLKNVI